MPSNAFQDHFWPVGPFQYQRHQPENTLLYQLVKEHWPQFQNMLAAQGRGLPGYVVREFEDYLKCGRLEHGFLRVRCESCHHEKLVAFSCKRRGFCPSCGARRMADSAAHLVDEVLPKRPIRQWVLSVPFPLRYLFATNPKVMSRVLTIVHRVISTFLIKQAGRTVKSGTQSGAVTLIQRFGSALNLNLHFHMLYLNGVYDAEGYFWPVKPPAPGDLDEITHKIARRVSRYLEQAGYLYRDAETEYLDLVPDEDDAMNGIMGASITYRLAFGTNAGKNALALQAVPTSDNRAKSSELVSKQSGFSMHAGVSCKSNQRKKLERLCRYITRPAIAEQRLSLASNGNVIVALKTPYDDGTSHVVLNPMEFMGRLAALVPKPRVNLTRFHGVFSPRSKLRAHAVPGKPEAESEQVSPSAIDKAYAMTWAQRLKRVFAIEIEKCEKCGGKVRVIASIEGPEVIEKILKHLELDEASQTRNRSPPVSPF
ncbi:MAG TPA: IS91 family transposase [Pseudomonadales bacterium]|nr:IS91 family transposase [Pseudomonadales bacterium]